MANPALQPVCYALRRLITSLDGGYVEAVWPKLRMASYGVGPMKITQHYAYIAVQAEHINLGFYHGASLADPADLRNRQGAASRQDSNH
jgi:hypothetical protein